MLKDAVRLCDVCGSTIPKGEKYAVNVIPRADAEQWKRANAIEPDMAATFTEDSQGRIRLDICLECRMNMGGKGDTVVN